MRYGQKSGNFRPTITMHRIYKHTLTKGCCKILKKRTCKKLCIYTQQHNFNHSYKRWSKVLFFLMYVKLTNQLHNTIFKDIWFNVSLSVV